MASKKRKKKVSLTDADYLASAKSLSKLVPSSSFALNIVLPDSDLQLNVPSRVPNPGGNTDLDGDANIEIITANNE